MTLGMTVRELLDRIDSRELSQWIAYHNIEPWGDEREDLRHGIRAAVTANSAFGSRGRHRASEYIPRFGRRPRMEPKEAKARFKRYAQAMQGGRVKSSTRSK